MSVHPARVALREGWPIFLTAFLVGVPFGVVARQAGLAITEASGMSLIIFAGAAQFAAVELLRTGAPAGLVVLTVLLLNLRHVLMGVALRPYFSGLRPWRRAALAYLLVDESFAMAIGWFRRGGTGLAYYVTFGAAMWLCWNSATLVGALVGTSLGDPRRLGVDFAITAVFIAIVVVAIRGRADVVVALVAALVAGGLRLFGAGAIAVVAAGLLAPLAAFLFRTER